MRSAALYACAGHRLTEEEKAFFADVRPWGLQLFRRNVDSPDQVRALIADFRRAVDDEAAPVAVDQEGGRVQRLGPPHWPKYPPAQAYLNAANDPVTACALARLGARLIAHDLKSLGIDIDYSPVIDVPKPGAHDIIGDRAFGRDPQTVARMGRAAAEGLLAGGVLPVIKHLPGHGRAVADTHEQLATVTADLEELDDWDFLPIRALSDMPIGMTAHIVFTAVDAKKPATQSKAAIRMIRERLGFGGLLLSDDLVMKALGGTLADKAARSLRAGCDLVIFNGSLEDTIAVSKGVGPLKGGAKKRAEAALARRVNTPEPLDVAEARERFGAVLAGRLDAARGPDVAEAQA